MTLRQRILKTIYPVIMRLTGGVGKYKKVILAPGPVPPPQPFYQLGAVRSDGSVFSFETLRGKKVLIVNTASDCGFTAQYEALEALWQQYREELVVMAFPANDFKAQETGSDEAIAGFCSLNYGISFPLFRKTSVVGGVQQHPVYRWLSAVHANGWNTQVPEWNFCKYLIDEEGRLLGYFAPGVAPNDERIMQLLERKTV